MLKKRKKAGGRVKADAKRRVQVGEEGASLGGFQRCTQAYQHHLNINGDGLQMQSEDCLRCIGIGIHQVSEDHQSEIGGEDCD